MSTHPFRFFLSFSVLMILSLLHACSASAQTERNYARLDTSLWEQTGSAQFGDTTNALDIRSQAGSLTLKSRSFFSAGDLTIQLGPTTGRLYGVGMLSADMHDGVYVSQDLPSYDGLALRAYHSGAEVMRRNLGAPVAGMQFHIRFSPGSLTIGVKTSRAASEATLFTTSDPQQLPGQPLQLFINVYNHTQVRFDRLLLTSFTLANPGTTYRAERQTTTGTQVTSIWSPPTSVTARPQESVARQDLTTVIENDRVRLAFKPAERGFGLGSMVFRENGRDAISQVDDDTSWWSVEIRLPSGKIVSVNNLHAPPGTFTPFADRSTGGQFVWRDLAIPGDDGSIDVAVTVRLVAGSSLVRMRIDVTNRLRSAGLWRIVFPTVDHLGYPGESDCMVPTTHSLMTYGELHRAATGVLYWAYAGADAMEYPTGGMPIQHLSCSIGDGTVVYIGCHDGEGNTKGYGWIMEKGLTFHVFPENMGVPGASYHQDWDYVIGPMKGDWFDAARVYRNWAIHQKWCARGRLEDRTDKPKEFFEVPYWGDPQWPSAGFRETPASDDDPASKLAAAFRPRNYDPNARAYDVQAQEMQRRVEKAMDTYGLPLGTQWYTWHHCRFDGNYPEYFPPRPGFEEALKATTRPGEFVHGFINGLWFDRSLPEFKDAAPYAMVDIDEAQKISSGQADPLRFAKGEALMCPATPYWQHEMASIAQKMASLGFQGAYLDVLANAGDQHCFDSSHGHPLGGGHWFVDGARKMVEGMKGDGKLLYICSEGFNETLGQAVDLFYTWTDLNSDTAPLLGAIYGGYLQWYGSQSSNNILLARSVFWGAHISLYASSDMEEGHEGTAAFISELVKLQRLGKKYLTYGMMVRPPDWSGAVPRQTLGTVELDAVEKAAWQASDGTIGVCLLNSTAKPVSIDLNLATVHGLQIASHPGILQGGGEAASARAEGQTLHVSLPPSAPVIVEIGTAPTE